MDSGGHTPNALFHNVIPILLSLFILVSVWAWMPSTVHAADALDSSIPCLASGSGEIHVDLSPDEADGFVCSGCKDLVRIRVNGIDVPHEIVPADDGKAALTATFSGLDDGRHKATAEASGTVGTSLPVKETLFIVDTTPPELELLEPDTFVIQPTQNTFLVRCRDQGAGISPDPEECGLRVTINGTDAAWHWTESEGAHALVIASSEARWDSNQAVILQVTVQDRAGNPAELQHSFRVETEEDQWNHEIVDCETEDGDWVDFHVLKRIPFPIQTSVHWIRFDQSRQTVVLRLELSTLQGRPMDSSVYEALEIVSRHPCIRVEKMPRSPDTTALEFRISQVSSPQDRESMGWITIQYPESVIFDYELACPEGEPEVTQREMTADGPMKTIRIPVSLHAETGYSEEVQVRNGLLTYRFLLAGPGSLDTADSWFDMEGTRIWLTETASGVYEASLPVTEGLHVYTTRLTLSLWGWGDVPEGDVSDGGRSLLKTGDVFVTMDPPRIDHFHYDRENECFRAVVSDQGTASEDLVMELLASGTGSLNPGFDPAAGTVEAPFPMPVGIQAGILKVTDLAGQTSTATCRIFGQPPPSLDVEGQGAAYPVTVKEGSSSGSYRPSNAMEERISRQYLGQYKDGREAVIECIKTTLPVTKEPPLIRCLNAARARFGTPTASNPRSGSSVKVSNLPMPAPNPAWIQAEKECTDKYPPGMRYSWKYEDTEECRTTWIDTLAPRIREVAFLPRENRVTALIDDHGMPLSELRIDYRIDPEPHLNPYNRMGGRFSFDTLTGLFLGEASRNATEIFRIEITATDAAGNRSRYWLDVTAPIHPPDVTLEILKKGPVAYPWGTCFDPSGIDHRKTRTWLDEREIHPIGIRYGEGISPDRVDFGPVIDEGPHMARLAVTDFAGLSSEASVAFDVSIPPEIEDFRHLATSLQRAGGPAFSALIHDSGNDLTVEGIDLTVDEQPVDRGRLYYDSRTGYFAADGPLEISPGAHTARLTATDAHGQSDEALLRFVPGERLEIHDTGPGDLSIEDVTLWELQDHNGDGRANPGETIRLFVALTRHGSEPLAGVVGRLESDEPDIVVEMNEVAYGTLEPGETLTPIHGFDIHIDEGFLDTRPSDPHDALFTLEATAEGGGTWLLDFRLPIYRPTLPFAVSPNRPGPTGPAPADPASANPIDPDPENPLISEVVVTLDPLPPHTEETEIEVTGTAASTASIIDEVMVRVNGTGHTAAWNPGDGTFSQTVPLELGDNLIEAEAVDRTGALGMDTGFVHRTMPYVPPEIAITEPAQGAVLLLDPGFLLGNFNPGSSTVADFQASMSAEGETVSVPIGYSTGEGTFWAGGGSPVNLLTWFRPGWGNNHETTVTITVTLTTVDGDTVEDTVTFIYVFWS